MSDEYTHRHKHQRVARDTDQLELMAIRRGSQVFEAGIADDRIAGAIQDIEDSSGSPADAPQFQRQDLSTEGGAGGVNEEVYRRQKIMKAAYPFKVTDTGIEYVPSASKFYEFCLATVSSPTITKGDFVGFPRQFERASAILVQLFIGGAAESLHVGAPRDKAVGTTFKKGMETLSKRTGEFRWEPEPGLPANPTQIGDEGVDFVVWRPMDDSRAGGLFVLCQCACGDDWLQKWDDLSLDKLEKWFRPMTAVKPMRAFATPFHAVDGNLRDGSRLAGLFFDRARLTLIAERHHADGKWATYSASLQLVSDLVLKAA
ncbi:MAG: hypothetical protein ACT4O6_17365 [Reyranella sp.]